MSLSLFIKRSVARDVREIAEDAAIFDVGGQLTVFPAEGVKTSRINAYGNGYGVKSDSFLMNDVEMNVDVEGSTETGVAYSFSVESYATIWGEGAITKLDFTVDDKAFSYQ